MSFPPPDACKCRPRCETRVQHIHAFWSRMGCDPPPTVVHRLTARELIELRRLKQEGSDADV